MPRKRRTKPTTLVDIVIPVCGRYDLLETCLDKIPEACGNISFQVIVFDSGSPKEDRLLFYKVNKDRWDYVKFYQQSEGAGFPKACNSGANKGNSPLIFFLNSDVFLDPGSIEKIVFRMDEPDVGVCGMKLVFPEDIHERGLDTKIRPAGKLQHICLSTNIYGRVHHIFLGWNEDNKRVNMLKDFEVFAVTGAALMTRRKIFEEVDGFFEGYGRGTYDDADLCQEIRKKGYRIVTEPRARGLHYVGATAEFYNLGYNLNGNEQIFLQRHGDVLTYWDWRTY